MPRVASFLLPRLPRHAAHPQAVCSPLAPHALPVPQLPPRSCVPCDPCLCPRHPFASLPSCFSPESHPSPFNTSSQNPNPSTSQDGIAPTPVVAVAASESQPPWIQWPDVEDRTPWPFLSTLSFCTRAPPLTVGLFSSSSATGSRLAEALYHAAGDHIRSLKVSPSGFHCVGDPFITT
jgi:hypothetical protein